MISFLSTVYMASVDTKNPDVLDVGTGTGFLSTLLMERYPEASFTLVDILDSRLNKETYTEYVHDGHNKGFWSHSFSSTFALFDNEK